MHMTVHRKALVYLPATDSANAPVQVSSNFLPRIQAVARRFAHSRMVMGQTRPKRATHCFDPLCGLRRGRMLLTFAVATSQRLQEVYHAISNPCTRRHDPIRLRSRSGDRRVSTRVRARGRRGSNGARNRAAGLKEWRAFPDNGDCPLVNANGSGLNQQSNQTVHPPGDCTDQFPFPRLRSLISELKRVNTAQ